MKFGMKHIALPLSGAFLAAAACAATPASSPYQTDGVEIYNKDDTADALRIISIVSCYVKHYAPELGYAQVGESPFVAMVDTNLCEATNAFDSTTGSMQTAKVYETAVVQAQVVDGALKAKLWIQSATERSWVNVTVVGGPSIKPPFGEWEVNWCGSYDPSAKTCGDAGYAKVDATGSRAYFQNNDSSGWKSWRAASGFVANDKKSGGGKYLSKEQNSSGAVVQNTEGAYAFNTAHLYATYRDTATSQTGDQCLIPKATAAGALKSSWETWLYDPLTGERLKRNSGFQFRDDQGQWGYAGYWGVSVGDTMPTNGSVVKRMDSNDQVLGEYTVYSTPGKLRKTTIKNTRLSDMDGILLQGSGPKVVATRDVNDANTWVTLSYKWDDANSNFVVMAYSESVNGDWTTQTLATPVTYTLAQVTGDNGIANGELGLDNLNGWVPGSSTNFNMVLTKWADDGSGNWNEVKYTTPAEVVVKSRSDVEVSPGDTSIPASLYCVGQCVDANMSDIQAGESDRNLSAYSWSSDLGTLSVGGQIIDLTNRNSSFWSGVLVAQSDLSKLACQRWSQGANANVDAYCEWYADSELNTYYRYESGPNRWNQWSGLKNESGQIVTFDRPLELTYAVPADDTSAGAYAGKTVQIQYAGDGNFWVPGYCFNRNTRARQTCSDTTEWANEFSIPFDEVKGVARTVDGSKQYLVKTLRSGVYYPLDTTTGACDTLQDQASDYQARVLPTVSDWLNPADPASPNYIGTWQEATTPPLIVDGVLQE